MMTALLRKELRALAPLIGLVLAISALSVGYLLCTEFPDEQRFKPESFSAEGGVLLTAIFAAVLAGAGLLVRESEEGTLHFLDALPVSRGHIFLGKVLAAGIVLAAVALLDLLMWTAFWALSRSSVDPPLPWGFGFAALGMAWVAAFAVFSLSLALGFSRQWFAFGVGFALWGYLWLAARGTPGVELLNPFKLEPSLHGGEVRIPWRHAAVQAGIGAGALALAFLGFRQLGARSRDWADRLASGRAGRWFSAACRLGTPAIWVAALVLLGRTIGGTGEDDADGAGGRPLGEGAFARRETAHYEFLFRESQREAAEEIIDSADGVYARVAQFYGVEKPVAGRVVVDLASPVPSHAAGVTNWTKIRMPLTAADDFDEQRLILAHETSHVFTEALSGSGLTNIGPSAAFFHEGFATYVDQHFVKEGDEGAMLRTAAAASSRGAVPFSLLADASKLAKTRDPALVYPLGFVFCRALVETCGAEAPARVIGALEARDRIAGHSGEALWRAALQACGFSLDRVVAAYDAEIARLLREEAEFIARLPRLSGRVEVTGDEVRIHARHEGDAPGTIVCEVHTSAGLGSEIHQRFAGEDGVIRFPRSYFPDPTARYLLGWSVEGLRLPVFEPWVEEAL